MMLHKGELVMMDDRKESGIDPGPLSHFPGKIKKHIEIGKEEGKLEVGKYQ
ncbi:MULTISPECIES: hypothetical protein [Salinicoccus]|uniref:hypothetical protein n=1 Tax=Salinicoccus TaxID=45669 RepID=UPI00147633ED|nr:MULTISPECIES: hypothetical protein [Salinicoccus]MBY8910604.1 hypothetical protein [Salinicoccus roseus]MCC4722499.1 hypothetical protein [Salinicoccus sp. RF5]MCG7331737.1 hypothetical protein [Salinicoccus roseus]GGA61507.1 hypothetical protein GCM10007176_02400 [Salinicoccus roseus]